MRIKYYYTYGCAMFGLTAVGNIVFHEMTNGNYESDVGTIVVRELHFNSQMSLK